jgi:hypothetical protein
MLPCLWHDWEWKEWCGRDGLFVAWHLNRWAMLDENNWWRIWTRWVFLLICVVLLLLPSSEQISMWNQLGCSLPFSSYIISETNHHRPNIHPLPQFILVAGRDRDTRSIAKSRIPRWCIEGVIEWGWRRSFLLR